jgi:hypothetical protein
MNALFHRQKRCRASGDGRRVSHAGVHDDRLGGRRLRRRSSRIESRCREVHQRRIGLDFNRHFAFCHPHWTVTASSRIVVHTDAGFADGETGID